MEFPLLVRVNYGNNRREAILVTSLSRGFLTTIPIPRKHHQMHPESHQSIRHRARAATNI
eukprot:scaffold36165_cov183-Amphora_coffeaeformis.AAC.4